MKVRSFLVTLLVLLGTALPAASQQDAGAARSPVYRVELIVFRAKSALGAPENWSAQATPRTLGSSVESAPAGSQLGRLISTLPPDQLQLTALADKLRSSGVYEPVAHVAWSQTASAWGTRAGFPVERLGIDVPGLSGTVFLERGQYLHLGVSLSYRMADPPVGLGAGPDSGFTLSESRRIRFYERNYYDHPAFGVIALVTPAAGSRPAGR